MLTTTDPRSGEITDTNLGTSSTEDVDVVAELAEQATVPLAALGRHGRSAMLRAIADALEASRGELIATADRETGLGEGRLTGELSRSIFQFHLFADALDEGSFMEAMIDHATSTTLGSGSGSGSGPGPGPGPGPDLRRALIPIGPVAVFGSSNFPFAFSVAGGDTASALAAGCPVVIKAHSAHPITSALSFDAIAQGISSVGAPEGTAGLVFGQAAGSRLVAHPAMTAVSFTGSLSGGEALQSIINQRKNPIPFYGELSSLNPLVITAAAVKARSQEIAQGLFASFTGSGGQLCTKPGIAFVPATEAGDALVESVRTLVNESSGNILLNNRIFDAYGKIGERLVSQGGAEVAARAHVSRFSGFLAAPTLLTTTALEFGAELTEECFGPMLVIVRFGDHEELERAFTFLPNSLTATIHIENDEIELLHSLTQWLGAKSGRIVYNGFPTGVRVAWAQHHGGPWPSTNSVHTSVGVTAMRRFLRPFVWQDAPEIVMPQELWDGPASVPRRVDGRLELPEGY